MIARRLSLPLVIASLVMVAETPGVAQPAAASTTAPIREIGVCQRPLLDPVDIAVRDTGFDQVRSGCGRSTLRLQTRAGALIDTPNFYGTLAGSMFAGLRIRENQFFEWEIGGRLADYRFAQNASITATELSYGPAYIAGMVLFSGRVGGRRYASGTSLRLSIPFTNTGYEVVTTAVTPAVQASLEVEDNLYLHGRAALFAWLAGADGGANGRVAVALSADAAWALARYFALAAGCELQGGWYGLGLDHALVRTGLRFRIGRRYRLDLGVAVPLAGAERMDFSGQLGLIRDL